MKLYALLLPLFMIAACTSTPAPDENTLPPAPERQSTLTALFDRIGGEESAGRKAAGEAARLSASDHRFFASLWGTRSSEPALAWRLGDAFSDARKHDESFSWYQRAFRVVPAHDTRRAYLRYEMAEECLALGKAQDAVNLLANRLDPAPLPEDLRAKYDALLDAAAKASR